VRAFPRPGCEREVAAATASHHLTYVYCVNKKCNVRYDPSHDPWCYPFRVTSQP